MDEIGSSVYGVDDECWSGSEFRGGGGGFFAQEAKSLNRLHISSHRGMGRKEVSYEYSG